MGLKFKDAESISRRDMPHFLNHFRSAGNNLKHAIGLDISASGENPDISIGPFDIHSPTPGDFCGLMRAAAGVVAVVGVPVAAYYNSDEPLKAFALGAGGGLALVAIGLAEAIKDSSDAIAHIGAGVVGFSADF